MCERDNLSQTTAPLRAILTMLVDARAAVAQNPQNAQPTLADVHTRVQHSFNQVTKRLKPIYNRLGKYSKALDKVSKLHSRLLEALVADKVTLLQQFLPGKEDDSRSNEHVEALSLDSALLNRAIALHLFRQGYIAVAETFLEESGAHAPRQPYIAEAPTPPPSDEWHDAVAQIAFDWPWLHAQFTDLYRILHAMEHARDLQPAIAWTAQNAALLDARGSDLAFNLRRMQFVTTFLEVCATDKSEAGLDGPLRAWAFAREAFRAFQPRYRRQIEMLFGAVAFYPNITESPYQTEFESGPLVSDMPRQFAREFCSAMGLCADAPLCTAVTAGTVAMPALTRLQKLLSEGLGSWSSTRNEQPIEIDLPESFRFHPIIVCPVSKDQTTSENPPMMLPCGHVLARNSLERISSGAKFKCPYCPRDSHPRDARRMYL